MKHKLLPENSLEQILSPLLKDLGEISIEVIKERVRDGIGSDGSPMPPYSEKNSKKSGVRNLEDTGQMLRDMTFSLQEKLGVVLGFKTGYSSEKAYWTHEFHPWFGLSDEDKKQISERISKRWKNNS